MLDERAFVNGIVGLMATGGSTNHTLHLVAMARAAGILLNWDDFADVSRGHAAAGARSTRTALADVNQFEAAGGMPFVIGQLLDAGLVHADVLTVAGEGGLERYRQRPRLEGDALVWEPAATEPGDSSIVRPASEPFSRRGRPQAAARQSRPRRDQDLGGQAASIG